MKRPRRTTSAPHTKAGERGGTRKSRVKAAREATVPNFAEATWLCLPHKGEGLVALENYVRMNPVRKVRGYADPSNPRNRRIAVNAWRINGTLRHPKTVKQLTGLLGFFTVQDYRNCLHAAQREELD